MNAQVYAIGSLALGSNQHGAAEVRPFQDMHQRLIHMVDIHQRYYSMALDHITPVLALNGLESIQSILCCAVYSIRSPVGASLWYCSIPIALHSLVNILAGKSLAWPFVTVLNWDTTEAPKNTAGMQMLL